MDIEQAKAYLGSLLNRVFHIYTTDNRMFVGEFKCTDNDRNIILSSAHEYRIPALPSAASTIISSNPTSAGDTSATDAHGDLQTVTLDLSPPRYIGLIVVPGPHITKIEVEGPLPSDTSRESAGTAALVRRKEAALVPGRKARGEGHEEVRVEKSASSEERGELG
ncbi:hypothetical protein MMC26_007300 [Xylographa opegraphella]|nr:hypothetical protein [Xylographa opegraphella]